MENYPKVLYRLGERDRTLTVNSEDSEEAAKANGWVDQWGEVSHSVPADIGQAFREYPKILYKDRDTTLKVGSPEEEHVAIGRGWKPHWDTDITQEPELISDENEDEVTDGEDTIEEPKDLQPPPEDHEPQAPKQVWRKRKTQKRRGRPARRK